MASDKDDFVSKSLVEASMWVWNNLWRADLPHSAVDILDVIFTSGTKITGWLFTMSDGKVKSKSKGRWNMDTVAERCHDYDGNVCGQILIGNTWHYMDRDKFAVDGCQSCIISTAQMSRSHQFIEQVFEKQHGIIKPKMASFRLCDSSVKGQSIPNPGELKSFPTERLVCSQRQMVEALKDKMSTLIHVLEQRSKLEISKMTCVFTVEDIGQSNYRVRLHHAKEVCATTRRTSRMSRQKSSGSALDTRSEISDITNMSRGTMRKTKCCGDFCTFNEDEEGSLQEMDRELNFDIMVERGKARRRHQRVNEGQFGDGYGEEGGLDADISEEATEEYRAHILAATGGGRQQQAVDPEVTKEAPPTSSASYKVPVKSLLLARKDMKVIDSVLNTSDVKHVDGPEVSHWWENLHAWYRRTGHAIVQKSLPTIPASSGHHIGRAMLHTVEHGELPDESSLVELRDLAPHAERAELTMNTLQHIAEDGSVSPSRSKYSKDVPFDLNDNPYSNSQVSSSKHLGRYYSSATVCHACYHVYKELDRRRKNKFKADLRTKRIEAEEKARENELHMARHLDTIDRQTNQKVLTYRLAQSKNGRMKKGSLLEENSASMSLSAVNSSHVAEAPKGQLPPLPWQLGKSDKRREYEQQGSTFVRNIHNKAQKMLELAAQKNKTYDDMNYDVAVSAGLDPDFDWRKMVANQYPVQQQMIKSTSAGSKPRRKEEKVKPRKKFNPDRLLHPYQRHLAALRRGDPIDESQLEVPARDPAQRPHHLHHSKSDSSVAAPKKMQGTASLPTLHQKSLPPQISAQKSGASGLPPLAPKTQKLVTEYNHQHQMSASKSPKSVSFAVKASALEEDSDGDDDDDDEIGWSPFMVSA